MARCQEVDAYLRCTPTLTVALSHGQLPLHCLMRECLLPYLLTPIARSLSLSPCHCLSPALFSSFSATVFLSFPLSPSLLLSLSPPPSFSLLLPLSLFLFLSFSFYLPLSLSLSHPLSSSSLTHLSVSLSHTHTHTLTHTHTHTGERRSSHLHPLGSKCARKITRRRIRSH